MINFILPCCFTNYQENTLLIEGNEYRNLFWGIEGNVPFSIFNGRVNNNKISLFASYSDIKHLIEGYEAISENFTIIDFGNMLLEEYDYENVYGEVILDEYASKSNVFFELADEKFIDYLVNKYPKIQIILHDNYTIFHDKESIQELIDTYPNNIKGINITILNLCENIDIPKIGVLSLDSCFYCPQFPLCLKSEYNNILHYRSRSIFNECRLKKMLLPQEVIKNLEKLLYYTNNIMFTGIAVDQIDIYMENIKLILDHDQKEKK